MSSGSGVNYDRDAAEYAAHRQIHPGIFSALVEVATGTSATHILEVGVGSGNYARAVHEVMNETVFGVDPSFGMLQQAAARGSRNLVRGRAEALPFDSGSFSFCYLVDVIHHIRDKDAFAREALRVLNPGGLVVIATDSELDIPRRVPLATYFPDTIPYELNRYPDSATIESVLQSAGFDLLERRSVEYRYPLTDVEPYRERAFSSLHGISAEAHAKGLAEMERDLRDGPIEAVSLYTLFSARKPA